MKRDEFLKALAAEGLPAAFYLRRVGQYEMFRSRTIYPPRKDGFSCPYDCPAYKGKVHYRKSDCPNAEALIRTGVILSMSEFYTDKDMRETAAGVSKVANHYYLRGRKRI